MRGRSIDAMLRGLLIVLVVAAVPGCRATAPHAPVPDGRRFDAIIGDLQPTLVIDGEPTPRATLAQRMEALKVPGVSIAVFEGGEILWARAFGAADVESGRPMTVDTLLQAASISKPIAATAALDLVEEGRLALDEDVNTTLMSWKVAADHVPNTTVTLRGLLTHTAGLSVSGFPGYGPDATIPDTAGVLRGEGNTPAVTVAVAPRSEWRYSGGGYTVMQQAVEDVTGRPFDEVMAARVLGPLGMTHSTYEQPLPAAWRTRAATGYRGDGTPVDGRWHVYPEQAAAGLWTTPGDLARWAMSIQAAHQGGTHPVLRADTIAQMLTPDEVGGHGLGPGLPHDGRYFGHGGANEGFRCLLTAQVNGTQGVAVMTNADSGSRLGNEVVLSVARVFGWDDHQPQRKRVVVLTDAQLSRVAGRYVSTTRADRVLEVRVEGADIVLTSQWDNDSVVLTPEAPDTFFSRDQGFSVKFALAGDGEGPATAVIAPGGTRFARVEP